jgi:hypothetical protein
VSALRSVSVSVAGVVAVMIAVSSACVIENSTPPYVPPAPRPVTRVLVPVEVDIPLDATPPPTQDDAGAAVGPVSVTHGREVLGSR